LIFSNYSTFRAHFATTATLAADGFEEWPVAELNSGGFTAGFTGILKPITAFPITISCNAQAADGGAAFHWYLSQRTDDPANQYFTITQLSATQSGSVVLALTSLAATELGLDDVDSAVTEDDLVRLLKYVDLYVQRVSDDAIQHMLLLKATLGGLT
jgi:hypothetical protein